MHDLIDIRGHCPTCKHFERKDVEGNGFCRESSPQVSVVVLPQQDALGRQSLAVQTVANFPPVGAQCWCGRWQGKIAMAS